METQLIINYIIYFALCFTIPKVCIESMFTSESKFTRVCATVALMSFFYIALYCIAFR